jgi:hypothetical protein
MWHPTYLAIVGDADVLVSKDRVMGTGDLDLQAAVLGEGIALLHQVLLELQAGIKSNTEGQASRCPLVSKLLTASSVYQSALVMYYNRVR